MNPYIRRIPELAFILLCIFLLQCGEEEKKPKEGNLNQSETKKGGKRILYLGDSLTAGYGLDGPEEGFVSLVSEELKKKVPDLEYVNAGVSGDTTSGGLARLDWVLNGRFDAFVLELGANDSMRGVSTQVTEENLREIIRRVRVKYPSIKILLIGMQTFPNMGPKYVKEFRAIFPRVAKSEKVDLMPFLLVGVAGDRSLNQSDGIHPTAKGHKIVAKNVLPYVEKLIR